MDVPRLADARLSFMLASILCFAAAVAPWLSDGGTVDMRLLSLALVGLFVERVAELYSRKPPPEEPAIPAPPEGSALLLSAVEMARRLRSRQLKSVDLVEAAIARVNKFNPKVNAIVRDRFAAARKEAQEADRLLDAAYADSKRKRLLGARENYEGKQCEEEEGGGVWWGLSQAGADTLSDHHTGQKALPPFLGVPMTVKEAFSLTGMPSVAGHIATRELRAARAGEDDVRNVDATVVRRMRAAGFIALGVTNTSELCMWFESDNPVCASFTRIFRHFELRVRHHHRQIKLEIEIGDGDRDRDRDRD